MRTLYHYWLNPSSRKIRLLLAEKELDVDMIVEKPWERRAEFLALNPAGAVPVLIDNNTTLCDSQAIAEYLEEVYPKPNLMGKTPIERAEVRRLTFWFGIKFHDEVSGLLLTEKVYKRFSGQAPADGAAIRAAYYNIHTHLHYIGYLMERRRWLAGDEFSLADIAAAAQLSCLDYLGDVPWLKHIDAKEWYVKVKSRPAFRSILSDHIAGMPPPRHYADLDF